MNKKMVFMLLSIMLLLSACGTGSSWEDEEVTPAASVRLLSDDVQAVWTIDQDTTAGSISKKVIRIEITKKDGERIDKFDVNHEKLLHLIIISKDLSFFQHIHPEYKGGGVFEIANDIPEGGDYRFIADFQPSGADAMSKLEWIHMEGSTAKPVPVVPDTSLVKSFDGKRVKLSIDQLTVNEETTLKYSITDDKTGQPVTDLQPYLGSIGHVVILTKDGEKYIHVHADEGQGAGPDATFETSFPKSGIYKIWGQFQRDNQVFTTSFVVNVP